MITLVVVLGLAVYVYASMVGFTLGVLYVWRDIDSLPSRAEASPNGMGYRGPTKEGARVDAWFFASQWPLTWAALYLAGAVVFAVRPLGWVARRTRDKTKSLTSPNLPSARVRVPKGHGPAAGHHPDDLDDFFTDEDHL